MGGVVWSDRCADVLSSLCSISVLISTKLHHHLNRHSFPFLRHPFRIATPYYGDIRTSSDNTRVYLFHKGGAACFRYHAREMGKRAGRDLHVLTFLVILVHTTWDQWVDKLTHSLKTTENIFISLKNGECCEAQRGGRPAELESEGEWKAELP